MHSKDRRYYFFGEDKWRVNNKLTFNLGLRYDNQKATPDSKLNFAPRAGFAYDLTGSGRTVVRGGIGKFYAYIPTSVDLAHQQTAVLTPFPNITVTDPLSPVLRPIMITDSDGNPGVAALSPEGQAVLNAQRASVLAGTTFNRNPRVDSDDRRLPYQWSWSFGVSHQLFSDSAVSVDYVGNMSQQSDRDHRHQRADQWRPSRRQRLRSGWRADSVAGARHELPARAPDAVESTPSTAATTRPSSRS